MKRTHHRAKLSDEQVREIRHLNEAGVAGYKRLAKRYRCGESTIRDFCTYRTRATA